MLGINSENKDVSQKYEMLFKYKSAYCFLYNSTLCDTIVFDELMNDEVIVWILIMSN